MVPRDDGSAVEPLDALGEERRRRDRRVSDRYRFLERRSGFDRRTSASGGRTGPFERLLFHFHRKPGSFLLLILAINLLNLADFGCTLLALKAGVQEANPFMAALFAQGPAVAGAAKIGLVLLVSGLLYVLKSFRSAIAASLLMGAGLLAVFVYHLGGLACCSW